MPRVHPTLLLLICVGVIVVAAALIGNSRWTDLSPAAIKAWDTVSGWRASGGPVWWSPNFLLGGPLAGSLPSVLTSLWALLWTGLFGITAGSLVASMLCVVVGAVGTYCLVARLVSDRAAALFASVGYFLLPALYVRIALPEHQSIVVGFAVLPWLFFSLHMMLRQSGILPGITTGAGLAALMLAGGGAAALALPALIGFGLLVWLRQPRPIREAAPGLLGAILATTVLGILPCLPSLREMGFSVGFDHSPMEGWRNTFSLKSAILWFDRDGLLTSGMPQDFAPSTANGGNYLGILPTVTFAILFLWRPAALYDSRQGAWVRGFLALALGMQWLSFGPFSVLTGQIEFLNRAGGVADPVVAVSWFVLVIQGWMIFRLLPEGLPARGFIAAGLIAIYMGIPGFRLISWLPGVSDIRSPQDFAQFVGAFCVVVAAGCGMSLVARSIPSKFSRVILAAGAIGIAAADLTPYASPVFQGVLNPQAERDFDEACRFLKAAPLPGRVHTLSGLYLMLSIPQRTGRGLTAEAFDSYLMQRGTAYLQMTSVLSPEMTRAWMSIAGVAYIVIDKTDPSLADEFETKLREDFPVVLENGHFAILANQDARSPAYLADRFVTTEAGPERTAFSALSLGPTGAIVLPTLPETSGALPGRVGRIEESGIRLKDESTKIPQTPSPLVPFRQPRGTNYQMIATAPAPGPGWLVIPESWHPDWRCTVGGESRRVVPVDGAFLGVRIAKTGEEAEFTFHPPWWYSATAALGFLGWLGFLVVGVAWHFLPASWRRRFAPNQASVAIGENPNKVPVTPIKKAVVVIPTYNESENIREVLDRILSVDPRLEALVVDDNSPDGTANLVRSHSGFGNRVHLIPRAGKLGLGSAYKEGFHWAFEQDFDACLEMDADFSHDPSDVPRLLTALDDGADAAIGSRYLGGVRVMNWPEHRLLLSTGASKFVRIVTGMPLTDATSGFKAVRTASLRNLDWNRFRAEGYGFQVELHFFLWKAGARLVEIPIIFTERREGNTKMTLGIAIEAAFRTLQLAALKPQPSRNSA